MHAEEVLPADDHPEGHQLDQDHPHYAGADQLPAYVQDDDEDAQFDVDLLDQVDEDRHARHLVRDLYRSGVLGMELPTSSGDAQGRQRDNVELLASSDDHLDHLGHDLHHGGEEEQHLGQDIQHPDQHHCLPGLLRRFHPAGRSSDDAVLRAAGQWYRWHAQVHRASIHAWRAAGSASGRVDASHHVQDLGPDEPLERLRDRHGLLSAAAGSSTSGRVCACHHLQDIGPDEPIERLRNRHRLFSAAAGTSAARRVGADHHVRDPGPDEPIERVRDTHHLLRATSSSSGGSSRRAAFAAGVARAAGSQRSGRDARVQPARAAAGVARVPQGSCAVCAWRDSGCSSAAAEAE